MAQETVEQLREEAAKQQGLATASKASLDNEKITLRQQQTELKNIQSQIVSLGQAAPGAPPLAQQQIANSIILLEQQKRRLQQTITQTNNNINSLATETVNYENSARELNQQADTLVSNQINPPQPAPVETDPATPPVGKVSATPIFGNPDIEVNISPPLQPNSVVVPDSTEFVGPPESAIQPQPIRQPQSQVFDELEDGSTVTIGPDGSITSTPSPIIQNGIGSTVLSGLAATGLAAGAAIIGGKLLKKAPENIQDTVRVAAITGAVGLATNALFGSKGLTTNKRATQGAQSNNNASGQSTNADWRVKLSLAEGQTYLYQSPDPGILKPLAATKGVIFPYLPTVQVNYSASYDPTEITHSNYKIFSYRQSSVDSITISGDFTAQDTTEANYLLAVIHFFKSVTKMFYGQDQNPKPGTPPPLCYLSGLGAFQFNQHPLVITNFNYTLPVDVDYIRASFYLNNPGAPLPITTPYNPSAREVRLPQYLKPGGVQGPPQWKTAFPTALEPTYVPTKMTIQLQAQPIVTRNDISKRFSLKNYASGDFYGGKVGKTNGRGIW